MKILVVEDDDMVRKMITQALTAENHDIEESADGLDAISKLECNTYDIVITDIVMPERSGASVGEFVKKNHLPTAVLAISAHGEQGGTLDFANYFADDTLSKPFSKEDMLKAVNNLTPGNDIDSALLNI